MMTAIKSKHCGHLDIDTKDSCQNVYGMELGRTDVAWLPLISLGCLGRLDAIFDAFMASANHIESDMCKPRILVDVCISHKMHCMVSC